VRRDVFTTIRSEGALLPPDFLKRIAEGDKDVPGLEPLTYHLQEREKLSEAITRSWNRLLGFWAAFQSASAPLKEGDAATGLTRDKWLLPLFQELGYGRLPAGKGFEIDGKSYPISHVWQNTPIHLLGRNVDLDHPTKGVAGAAKASPHGLVQEFLNRYEGHLWGFLSNGLKLRILRDNKSLTRQAYVEFDLAAMMDGQVYSDFAVVWLLCHQSRVEAEQAEQCWLEKWADTARQRGTRALDQLRDGVQQAIEALGRGFLDHPASKDLVAKLRDGSLDKQDYYRQLLRIVYRLIFLFVAEDRDLLLTAPKASRERDRYQRYYSVSRLRNLAERRRGSPHPDLWQGLGFVFAHLSSDTGCAELGLPALGSFLWSDKATPDLDRSELANTHLLEAVRSLAFTLDGKVRRAIDYRNLGAEELGSVYESLLELHPDVNADAPTFDLKVAAGHERKTTGSYYTPTSLIECLLDSALEPVVQEALKQPDPEKAILDLKVCDPACGSGHFLIAAAHRMANHLAAVRTGDEEPSPEAVRKALRDIVGRCLYGVDINPMAVELCKINLWLEALEPGRPLSFLEHHIQCGNSLLGATPALLKKGIPDEAFEPLEGDDKAICRIFKKKNKAEREGGQGSLLEALHESADWFRDLAAAVAELEAIPDDAPDGQRAKQERWEQLVDSESYGSGRLWADAWCAAFVWEKVDDSNLPYPITEAVFRQIERDPLLVPDWMRKEARRLADEYQLLHWHLAFPGVFGVQTASSGSDGPGWTGGFDLVLGNPPWDRIKLNEREFFAAHRPEIVAAPNAAARGRMIKALADEDRSLFQAFHAALRRADGESALIRETGRYPLCGRGDVNTYAVFAELNRSLLGSKGRAGFIVPSGIATDDTTKFFFQELTERGSLASLYDFQSGAGLFAEIGHARFKFCLLTLAGRSGTRQAAEFAFFLRNSAHLDDPERRFELSAADIALLNPNTRTCPIFRSRRDAEITKAIYQRAPVLLDEGKEEAVGNPWGVEFQAMFHMSNDSALFRTAKQLEADGFTLAGNVFQQGSARYVPLYEAKMIHHFNHRYGDYADKPEDSENTSLPDIPAERLADPSYAPLPRYWVPGAEVADRLRDRWDRGWLLGWRDITNATNERTVIAAAIPRVAVGNKFPLMFLGNASPAQVAGLVANLSAFVFDYAARQKLGGTTMNYFIYKQLPVFPPRTYDQPAAWARGLDIGDWIHPRVLELVYTSWDLQAFALDLGYDAPPFRWDPDRRFRLRCELDAAFFHLYGISGEDCAYILDTFPIVRANDETEFGIDRTKQTILHSYDELTKAAGAAAHPIVELVGRMEAMPRSEEAGARVWEEPFERVRPLREERHKIAIPLVSLKVAAGAFSDDQAPEFEEWVRPRTNTPLAKGLFVAQVLGTSMEPDIPNGSFCLFRRMWTTPRNGSVVVIERHSADDPETGGGYTVKRFHQRVEQSSDGTRSLRSVLEPANPEFPPIVLDSEEGGAVRPIAELVEVLR
jgi:SOS-response transcriptional repressor LexA